MQEYVLKIYKSATFADTPNTCFQMVYPAWSNKQILIASNSIEQSTENLRLNEDRYHAGTSTMSDLLDVQTLYQRICDKFVETYAQYQVRIVEYLQATGR